MQPRTATVLRRSLLTLALLTTLAACEGEEKGAPTDQVSGNPPGSEAGQPLQPANEQTSEGAGRASSATTGDPQYDTGAVRVQIQQEIAKLLDNAYLPLIDSKIAAVRGEVQQIGSAWGPQSNIVSYGDAAYIWTNRETTCPNGQYVTGIKVRYRGSCNHQCDADGGIIGNIELVCRSLK